MASTTSGFSGIMLERVIVARSELYYGRFDPLASSSIVEPNSRDLCAIGSLFQPNPKQGSWPKYIDFNEDEGTSQSSNVASNPTEAAHHPQPSHDGSLLVGPPPTPRHTPPKAAGYISPQEFPEFQRGLLNSYKVPSRSDQSSGSPPTPPPGRTPCTTMDGSGDERVPEGHGQTRTAASTRHTPSHRSFGTNDDGNGRIREPTSPRPWSPYDRKRSNSEEDTKE